MYEAGVVKTSDLALDAVPTVLNEDLVPEGSVGVLQRKLIDFIPVSVEDPVES
jgi:hypothetical protein